MIRNADNSDLNPGPPPDQQFREYYNALYRNLRVSSSCEQACQVIGISSVEGCSRSSVVASNLAICVAGSLEDRDVLLINADPANRVPQVTFGLRGELGIYEVLQDGIEIDDVIRPTRVDNLAVIGCGTQAGDSLSAEGLLRFRSVVATLRSRFATIIVDLPVAREFTSCFDMAAELDGVVLAVESQRVNRRVAQATLGKLRFVNADVLGCVFVDS